MNTASSDKGKCIPMEKRVTSTGSEASEEGEKYDVFLSHSGKQKDFIRQLHRDLTNQGVHCFFDQDRDCLPLAKQFPPRIFQAVNTCQVALLLLSQDFLGSKWPMLELSPFLQARDIKRTNRNLKILPLFFLISPDALKNSEENDEKWQKFEKSREKREEWQEALRAIRPINGLMFSEGGDEVKFREEIVKEIWRILGMPSQRYHVRGMQGEARMCQEVADFFRKVQPKSRGFRIVGLYGIAGNGKTTLAKAFCNSKLGEFEGKVCHLEFGRGDPFERAKLALHYLTHPHQWYFQTLSNVDQAKVELHRRVEGKRVLLVLDNITEESMDEVRDYLKADFGGNSWILLTARSAKLLEKYFEIDRQSCMHVPSLSEEEAISILLERAFAVESSLKEEDTGSALKCAKRCLFKEVTCDNVPIFHPLVLKAFGGYLLGKYGLDLPKWVSEIDGMVHRHGDSLDEVFALLGKSFDDMPAKYRTIFMLLTVYFQPNMSPDKVIEWLAINCNEKISFIEKALQDLRHKAFIEEFDPEIRIHDLYVEFAQRKADKMERWLWWKREHQYDPRGLISEDKDGFELAKLEHCVYETMEGDYVRNLIVFQLLNVQDMSTVDFHPMKRLRSITLCDCKSLIALDGMEKLRDGLAWLQIKGVNRYFKLPDISRFRRLQHLQIDTAGSWGICELGDLTNCSRLREIYVLCPSLFEFPLLKGMKNLEKVEFSLCDNVVGTLDCRDCVKLQTIVLTFCSQMADSPLLAGCEKLSKLVLSECSAVTTCPAVDVASPLKTLELHISSNAASAPCNLEFYSEMENLQLWNMEKLMKLPSFDRLSNLTVLKLGKCGIMEAPDLTGCKRLQNVYFFSLKNLKRFPNFSILRELKKLSLCDCISVQDPPDIGGCHKLEVFHLLYNDNMNGVSKMEQCTQLEKIQVSWRCVEKVAYRGFVPDNCQLQVNEELEDCLEYWKEEKFGKIGDVRMPEELEKLQCVKGKTIMVKRYFRGVRLYYSLTSPYEWLQSSIANGIPECQTPPITLLLMHSKVAALGMTGRECIGRDWLNKVRGYFAEREAIVHVRDASGSYDVPPIQGGGRMFQMLAEFFDTVRPNEKGIKIAGLYGMPGLGKTKLARDFCIRNSMVFSGRAFYVDFVKDETVWYSSHLPMLHKQQPSYILDAFVKGQSVLLVIDHISDENIVRLKYFLGGMELGENSCVLLCTPSVNLLKRDLEMDSRFCMHVPSLTNEDAIAILMERAVAVESGLAEGSMQRNFIFKCAKKCSFEVDTSITSFHPLALKVLGRYLFHKHGNHFSNWACEMDEFADSKDAFGVLEKVWESMEDICRTVFTSLVRDIPPNMLAKKAIELLSIRELNAVFDQEESSQIRARFRPRIIVAKACASISCDTHIPRIKKAVVDLHDSAFIEEIQPQIRIHELFKEFLGGWVRYRRTRFLLHGSSGYFSETHLIKIR